MKFKNFLFLIMFSLIFSQYASAKNDILQPEDHLIQAKVGRPLVSPNGKLIIYSISRYNTKSKKNISDLYIRTIPGGKVMKLTNTPGSEKGYSWSPDSKSLAFSAKREGDKKNQIYVININGGEARRITSIKTGASSPAWSPNGKWIAFYSSLGQLYSKKEKKIFGDVRYHQHLRFYHLGKGWDTGKRRRIFLVSSKGGKSKQLTKGECADEGDHSLSWNPNSKEIAFVSNRSKEWWNTIDTDIFKVNINSLKIDRITKNTGPDHSPAYSPDGKYLAYRASYEYNYESENYKIHIISLADGKNKAITKKLDRNVRTISWGPRSRYIYFTASDQGNRNLQAVDIKKPDFFKNITRGVNIIYSFQVITKNSFIIQKTTDTLPGEIYSINRGKLRRLTFDAGASYKKFQILPSEEILIKADDGTSLQGWLIKPLGFQKGKPVPLLLHIHGGPHGMSSPSFRFEYQLYANHGFAVLYTNPRGSDGYGQKFKDTIHEDWSTKPFSDLMLFIDHVVKNGIADPEKLAVKGGSYGGYMTNWIITHTNKFSAAISVAGIFNMVSFWGSTDEQFFAEKEMTGSPWEKKEVYIKNSPIWYSNNLKTPTMVIHGDNDWRVRTEQAEQLFVALQKMGVPSVYANFPKEQHGVRGKTHRTVYYKLVLDWMSHWLKGEPVKLAKYNNPVPYSYPPQSSEKK